MNAAPNGLRFSERKLWEQSTEDEPTRNVLARLARTRENKRSLEDQLATFRSEAAYVRGHLEGYASMLDRLGPEANLLDLPVVLREDAGRLGKLGGGGE